MISRVLLFLVCSLFLLNLAFAEEKPATDKTATTSPAAQPETAKIVGEIIWVKGTVEAIDPAKHTRKLERRSPIFEFDTIVTTATGSGQIKFTDDSVLVLREGTTLRIDNYKFTPDLPRDNQYVGSIVKGGFRTITGLISKNNPEGYKVKTPVATIGVRGTQYAVFYTPSKGLATKLDKGAIIIGNKAGVIELDAEKKRLYAVVKGMDIKPVITKTASPEFKGQPCFSANGKRNSTDPSCTYVPNRSSTTGSPKTGTVSGFCIQ